MQTDEPPSTTPIYQNLDSSSIGHTKKNANGRTPLKSLFPIANRRTCKHQYHLSKPRFIIHQTYQKKEVKCRGKCTQSLEHCKSTHPLERSLEHCKWTYPFKKCFKYCQLSYPLEKVFSKVVWMVLPPSFLEYACVVSLLSFLTSSSIDCMIISCVCWPGGAQWLPRCSEIHLLRVPFSAKRRCDTNSLPSLLFFCIYNLDTTINY